MLSRAIADGKVDLAQNIAAELAKKKVNLKVDIEPPGKPIDIQVHRQQYSQTADDSSCIILY